MPQTNKDEMKRVRNPDGWELPQKVERVIPHQPPMCVVDDLTFVAEKYAEATVTLRPESPFIKEDGTLEEVLYVEMIAQTIAAGSGFEVSEEKRKDQSGYLLGIKNLRIEGVCRAGDELLIKARKTGEYGDFGIIEGSVECRGAAIAAGELKVLQIFKQKEPGASAG